MNCLITQRHEPNKYGMWVDILENPYVEYFESFGLKLIALPNKTANLEEYISNLGIQRIILSGGNNVSPNLYGSARTDIDSTAPIRDAIEYRVLDLAIEKNIPVLGICKGMQLINVYFGGRLVVDDPDIHHEVLVPHVLQFTDKELKMACKYADEHTNSYHNQHVTVENVPDKLNTFATAVDSSVVEGLNAKDHPIAGIQWHPERPGAAEALGKNLTEGFIDGKLFWQ